MKLDPPAAPQAADNAADARVYLPRMTIRWLADEPGVRVKTVEATAVFVDVAGFTAMSERLARMGRVGAEEVADAIGEVFGTLLTTAYENGGSLLKFGGDALLLLFTGEDHPLRAVRAAVGMRTSLRDLGPIATSAGQVRLRVSAGVHSDTFECFLVGEAHRELIVAGRAMSTTVAMEAAARSGETVVSAATAAHLPAGLVTEQRGEGRLLSRNARVEHSSGLRLPDSRLEQEELLRGIPVALREHVAAHDRDSEHRRASIAFIGFAGVDQLDTETARAHIDALVVSAQRACTAHGVTFLGTDVAVDGGKIILAGGVPTSAGEDEQRLLLAACEIRDSGSALPLRIGVNTGSLFAGDVGPRYRRTYTVMGDTVNLAARVMARADPGSVLAAAAVLEAADIEFSATPVERFMAKGKRSAVEAAIVHAPLGSKRTTSPLLPLVGRELEQKTLGDALALVRTGHGTAVEVVGPAGIGKTRLLDELRGGADGIPQLLARCELYESHAPYLPYRRILQTLLNVEPGASPAQVGTTLIRTVQRVAPALEPWLPLLAVVAGADVPPTTQTDELGDEFRAAKLAEATCDLLAALIDYPAMIAFEDVHWMDSASIDLTHTLLQSIEVRPWLLCLTRRDEPDGYHPPEPRVGIELRPRPLTDADSERLIAAATESAPLRQHDAQTLARRSGGNPLFLHGLLEQVSDSGSVVALPDTIEGMVVAQVDRLSPDQRRLVRHASVLGLAFTTDMVAAVMEGAPPPADAWRGLDEILAADGPGRYRFRHALTRDAAYEGLPFKRRRQVHARAAAAFEAHRDDPGFDLGRLAIHYLQAGDHEQAWINARDAARAATAQFAIGDACANYERALESGRHLTELDSTERAETLEALGDLEERLGRYAEAGGRFGDARRQQRTDPVAVARLCYKHSMLAERSGTYPLAIRWLRRGLRGLDGAEDVPAVRQRARLDAAYGMVRLAQGRRREAVTLLETAIAEATASDELEALAHAYFVLDWALTELGRASEAVHSQRALQIYADLGQLGPQAAIYNNLGTFAFPEGRWDDAVELYERSYELRLRLGDTVDAATSTHNIAEVLSDQGHLDEAQQRFEEALRVWRAADYRLGVAYATSNLGRVAYRQGRFEHADELLDSAREIFAAMSADVELVETQAREAECLLLQGMGAEALVLADDALNRCQALGSVIEAVMLQRVRGYALAQMERHDDAREAFAESSASARELGLLYELAVSLDAQARLERSGRYRPERSPARGRRAVGPAGRHPSGRVPARAQRNERIARARHGLCARRSLASSGAPSADRRSTWSGCAPGRRRSRPD